MTQRSPESASSERWPGRSSSHGNGEARGPEVGCRGGRGQGSAQGGRAGGGPRRRRGGGGGGRRGQEGAEERRLQGLLVHVGEELLCAEDDRVDAGVCDKYIHVVL